MLLAERAPALEASPPPGDRPNVADREDVETGWYTARNLYQTVCGELPWLFQTPSLRLTVVASPARKHVRPNAPSSKRIERAAIAPNPLEVPA